MFLNNYGIEFYIFIQNWVSLRMEIIFLGALISVFIALDTTHLFQSMISLPIFACVVLFEVVGEREESVFKQFGVLIATILAAVKAIYDFLSTH